MEFSAMVILAVDTCLEPGSLALQQRDSAPEVVPLPPGWRSTTVQEELALLLGRHGLTTRDISGYGVTAGPGSFTGVRIGLTVVKALAEVHHKPIVPVSTLELLVVAAREANRINPPPALASILDARRGQIFGAVYQAGDDGLKPILEATVCSLQAFLEQIKATGLRNLRFCGTDFVPFLAAIEKAGWDSTALWCVSPHLAGVLAQIATSRLRKGLGVSSLAVDASYVRASDAELFWKE
ncbi:MAG: tRNA (adenosine(37)-N6)-threonylcarbamoyltransferase complex dimerization subunit type 1 TsaB [Acidobacteria bacterium]|nr:tRNA (adenosine(37)-N6)-threonylcarbamoyltransferase complex dimerization subunit type 1 TsaB [Acidobacteriota bacterium]